MKRIYLIIVICLLLLYIVGCGEQGNTLQDSIQAPGYYEYHPEWCSVGSYPPEREDGQYFGISILDYGKEWYVERPQKHVVIPVYDIPKEQERCVVKLPKTYEAEVDGIYYEVNFFQETYEYNDLIQVHIKMTSRLGYDVEYHSAHKKIRFENASNGYTVYPSHYRDRDCYEHTADPDILVFRDGESVQFEEILVCDPRVFVPSDTISCIITPQLFEKMYEPSVVIPVEIVRVE